MDVVYTLGNGSTANDWEMRISLRSIEAHFPELRHVWIIGHRPAWLRADRARHLPQLDSFTKNKDANLVAKLLRAALEPEVSEEFIFMSDDQFFLRETKAEDFRAWHTGEITDATPFAGDRWHQRVKHTAAALRAAGLPSFAWDAHVPYKLSKAGCLKFAEWPFGLAPGFTVMTLYHGINRSEPVPIGSDRIRANLRGASIAEKTIRSKLAKNRFASINPDSLQSLPLIKALEARFPRHSSFEVEYRAPVVSTPPAPRQAVPRPFFARPEAPAFLPSGIPLIRTR